MALLIHNINKVAVHPASIFAIVGVFILIGAYLRVKKVKLDAHLAAQIGIAIALAVVLKLFKLYHLPQGGSITLGSMLPIILLSMAYSPAVGYLTGFLYGMIDLLLGPYILHPVQVLFDYPLPFMALGVAGYFHNYLWGTVAAVFARFLCHLVSGAVFFASYAPAGMSPWIYSLTVNGLFMGVEGAICLVLAAMLPWQQLQAILHKR